MHQDLIDLLRKYDLPTPRYTSYPTVPFWNFEQFSVDAWKEKLVQTYENENSEICIYIHLPFCEELCTYCACNKRITKNHSVEAPYLESVIQEWFMYKKLFVTKPTIKEIHLGGGTPTFFSPEHLKYLIEQITENCNIAEDHEFSVEVHPNFTKYEHLKSLREVGFNRVSLGVQDFDPVVQMIINRVQTFERTQEVIQWARALGYYSINVDLIYGLPKQTLDSIKFTFEKVIQLMPDRIAFYSYAHVPWKSKVQRRYTDDDLPKANEKWEMYNLGNHLLYEMGFVSIGMDHFALPTDKLLLAYSKGELHRNFMGYTTTNHKLVLGLGVSSISDSWTAFAQNDKVVEDYQKKIKEGVFPIVNGHLLSEEDILLRKHILALMCTDETNLNLIQNLDKDFYENCLNKVLNLEKDGLLTFENNTIKVTKKGKLFIRNIASSIDAYLFRNQQQSSMFSKAI
ncbi:MAG: oxygen-independent coproporphyrinogen III oxidase [Saprospiraceae bacterium]|nr:oxygen-independent coproporphyrinogen III oxidase [Saprospiraceae bacterium]